MPSLITGFWVPPVIGPAVIPEEVRAKLARLATEIKRRGAGCALGSRPDVALGGDFLRGNDVYGFRRASLTEA